MTSPSDLPDAKSAEASALAWAEADPALAVLLHTGYAPAVALLRWGADLYRAGRAQDAITAFRASLGLAPNDAVAWTNLAIALGATGDADAQERCFIRSIELGADDADTWILLGMARERSGALDGAEDAYRHATALDPSGPEAWKCLGTLLAKRRDPNGAIAAFRAALAGAPTDAAVSASLGKVLYEEGRLEEALAAYGSATTHDPTNPHFRRMARCAELACALDAGAPAAEAIAAIEARAPLSEDELGDLVGATAAALTRFGHHDAALRLAKRRAELWPNSPAAHYLLASLIGAELLRSPDDYIVASFDAFADGFDAQLVDVLGYDVPEKLCGLIHELTAQGQTYVTLDGGCGTGLCGPLLRPLANTLTGVDLSSKMLDRARDRGVYDALVCEELTAYLERQTAAFDLVVAADVLIYFGDLRPVLTRAARSLRPGGLFALSVERGDTDDYKLLPSGRFAHQAAYIEGLAREVGFETAVSRETTLRREGHARLHGTMFVLRRRR